MQNPIETKADITIEKKQATIVNGKIKAVVSSAGKLTIFNSKGDTLLEEYVRNRKDVLEPNCRYAMNLTSTW